ncbi:MAG: site-specific DNA-methyltransferase [Methylococcales bacterium]|nr:site-specific DNA-methyltransferase [Methylococcales bacterium]
MPTLDFKGKQYIYSHHHSVPFRELLINSKKSLPVSGKKPSLDDNLIIHGDNLHALKALMPQYAGKIKCIYIDPPYNTGNEGWCYNDNVNSQLMKDWLKKNANPVDKEDMERHDKWLCMIYPRLKLLHELLADDGVIFISIDDNEVHHLRAVMDEIWGEGNWLGTIVWKKKTNGNNVGDIPPVHDYIICYCKQKDFMGLLGIKITEDYIEKKFSNPDNDPRGPWDTMDLSANHEGPHFPIINQKTGKTYYPAEGRYWVFNEKEVENRIKDGRIIFGKTGKAGPVQKVFLKEKKLRKKAESLWDKHGLNSDGMEELGLILGKKKLFDHPKPSVLLKNLLDIATEGADIILDSFSGTGTTAQAVLDLNKEDGGNRKFILVEMEDYADSITAERVRRVIKGVPAAKDEKLKAGLGGSFTFCELGKEISIEKIIKGESLPDYGALASYVFYTATGKSLDGEAKEKLDYFVGGTDLYEVYLIYKPDIAFLRSNDSALNDIKLKAISARNSKKEKLVFATAKYMGQKELSAQNITFCQLPYAIHKVVGA